MNATIESPTPDSEGKRPKERFLEATARLLERQGYQSTGLNQVVRESGAPKGSLYYYFPGGKEELVAEAVRHAAFPVTQRIRAAMGAASGQTARPAAPAVPTVPAVPAAPAAALREFLDQIAHHLEASDFQAGGPISTAALEAATTSDRVREACDAAYDEWVTAFRAGLDGAGIAPAPAARLATLIVSAIEGAVVLARVQRSTEPLQDIAEEIGTLLDARSTTE